jgi:hypothetical protein
VEPAVTRLLLAIALLLQSASWSWVETVNVLPMECPAGRVCV